MLTLIDIEKRLNDLDNKLSVYTYEGLLSQMKSLVGEFKEYISEVDSKLERATVTNTLISELYNDPEAQHKLKQAFTAVMANKILVYSPTQISIVPSVLTAQVDWNSIPKAERYYLYITQVGNTISKMYGPTTETFMIVPDLKPDTEYEVYIRAEAGNELSDVANHVTFKTKEIN